MLNRLLLFSAFSIVGFAQPLVLLPRDRGRTPCCAGLDQIVFTLPADTPNGCYVPVTVRTCRHNTKQHRNHGH